MIGMNSILLCLLLIGLASKIIQSDSLIIKWFVELSYPIYIIHIIPVTMMSAVFLSCWVKPIKYITTRCYHWFHNLCNFILCIY